MPQLLLFPDPRPLVERLGRDFFLQAPECAGVYLMRDAAETVLYVGKARNLRKRLNSYRVANPDRMPRRHLRLLRAVARIELQPCADEAAALAKEAELLLALRPRFNRAGTWPKSARFLAWRLTAEGLDLAVTQAVQPEWSFHGPMGGRAISLRAALVRLLWCALHPERGLVGMPKGWFAGEHTETTTIPRHQAPAEAFEKAEALLQDFFDGRPEELIAWISECTVFQTHPFAVTVREADLEGLLQLKRSITDEHR